MKKKVRQYAQQIEVGTKDRRQVLKDFSRMLDNQVRYVHDFLSEYTRRSKQEIMYVCICALLVRVKFIL